MSGSITDLRSALELLRAMPGELVETDVEVDPAAELSGVYRYVGAGGIGMAVLFLLIAAAVSIFISMGAKTKEYEYQFGFEES